MIYTLVGLISFILGIIFDKYVLKRFKLVVKVEKNAPAVIKLPSSENTGNKYFKAESLINYVKTHDNLPIRVSTSVLWSLKEIAKSPNWQKEIDDFTLENLNKIYDKLQRSLKPAKRTVQKVGKAFNMDEPKYWEGTQEEYEKALEAGVIDENTEVNIIIDGANYHGSWIEQKADGSVEEYME